MNGILKWNTVRLASTAALAVALFGFVAGCGSQEKAEAEKETTETLTTGTEFVASLQNTIDTGKNKVGEDISLRTTEPVRVNAMEVVPAGSSINGEITHIDPAGRIAGGAELTLRFTELVMPDGKSYAISCDPFRLKGKGEGKSSALQIGGGAAAGALIGGLVGGKDDIGKGAAAGAIIGTGVAVATKGDQIVLPAGQKMKVALNAPVTIVTKPAVTS